MHLDKKLGKDSNQLPDLRSYLLQKLLQTFVVKFVVDSNARLTQINEQTKLSSNHSKHNEDRISSI